MSSSAQPRKPRVIDINALLSAQAASASNANAADDNGGNGEKPPSNVTAATSAEGAPRVLQPYTYSSSASAETDANNGSAARAAREEGGRVARRRAEMELELRAREAAEADEALKQRVAATVAACAPAEDEDEEVVMARFEALQNKLDRTKEVFSARFDGDEGSYRSWASAEIYKREEAERALANEARKARLAAEAVAAEERWVLYLASLIEGIIDNIDSHAVAAAAQREADRIAALDRQLEAEASERIVNREAREAVAARERAEFESRLLSSADPMIEAIRRERHERMAAVIAREAEAEADEEAALEAKLARLSSLGSRRR